jgi:hypothetical protein
MSGARQAMGSEYMHWAKTRSSARFNLATSGLGILSLSDLGVRIEDLELTRAGGYGYEVASKRNCYGRHAAGLNHQQQGPAVQKCD